MTSDSEKLKQLITDGIAEGSLRKLVLSRPVRNSNVDESRIELRPVLIRGGRKWQVTRQVSAQQLHENLPDEEARTYVLARVGSPFRDINLTTTEVWSARYSKKGVCRLSRLKASTPDSQPAAEIESHDRTPNRLIPDNQAVPFLVATGIMSPAGRVRQKFFRKFRQINRYLEFVRDVESRLPTDAPIRIVDFGSGKSYLTFAVHHYLTEVLKRQTQITGLDRRRDVIDSCRGIVTDLELSGIDFQVGDIASFQPQGDVHMTISLHACDTATDDALAAAIAWKTDVIFAVPCCHHELASCLETSANPVLSANGIMHERFAELATDAVRAQLLDRCGYRTSIVEFIEMEHTPRNLLIRAVKRSEAGPSRPNPDNWQQLTDFCGLLSIPPLQLQRTLEKLQLISPR